MKYVTVVTPTYNRANCLPNVYRCLLNQTFKEFEWLIIDDGSTDETEKIVSKMILENKIPIVYKKKKNGGKHTALNYCYQFVETDYLVILDSDDELLPNALQDFHDTWEQIEDKDRYWCISARCIDSQTNKFVGNPYCNNINALSGYKKRRAIARAYGEKCTFRKTNVLAANPFPIFETTKFVSEDMIWSKIHKQYDQYCINNVVRIYHTEMSDGLSKGNMHSTQRHYTYYYLSRYIVNEDFSRVLYQPSAFWYVLHLSRCAMEIKLPYNKVMVDVNGVWKKILVTLGYPFSWVWVHCIKKLVQRG